MKTNFRILILFCFLLITITSIYAQTNTVGLIINDSVKSYNGYTLFSPLASNNSYLIDNRGYLIHEWSSQYKPAQSVMLLPDGSLLRPAIVQSGNVFLAGGAGGRVERFDWGGNLIWSFDYYSPDHCTHHDIEYLPNGDILMIAWENKTYAEAIAAGRNPARLDTALWPGEIIEVKPTGNSGGDIVWQWRAWDHLIQDFDSSKANYGDVSKQPELIDINYGSTIEDWLHINSVRYNPKRDEILLSAHNFSEIWVIDHSTTTAEAAGHTGGREGKGGDLLYRWGNPQAYRAGTAADQKLFSQHDARWIDSGLVGQGDILVFNNDHGAPPKAFSTVDEITPPLNSNGNYYIDSTGQYGPNSLTWRYEASPPASFYAKNISGEERMPNGNTLVCDGTAGRFFELDNSENIVWEYINPVTRNGILNQGDTPSFNLVFKIYRYSADYSGLAGKDLSEKGKIELYPSAVRNDETIPLKFSLGQNYPNPFNPSTVISYQLSALSLVKLDIYNVVGEKVAELVNKEQPEGTYKVTLNASNLTSGIYFYQLKAGNFVSAKKMILLR